jgi:inner membrane protein
MTGPTHVAFAELVYLLLLTTTGVALNAANGVVVALSSLLADIDTESSILGRLVPFVALPIERRFGHRTLTHSAIFVLGLALAALPLWATSRDVYLCLVIGYATHPFLDTMNISGVQLFYPFARVRCVFPFDVNAPARFRTATGSRLDRALGMMFLAGCIPTFLISHQGHERFIRLTQRTIESAVRDYNELSMTHRVVADVKGHNLFTKGAVQGRYEIVGAIDGHTLLFRDRTGTLHTIGREHEAEYTAQSVVCFQTEPVLTVLDTVELVNQPLAALADVCDPEGRTFLFGDLLTRDAHGVGSPTARFAPVTGRGQNLHLDYATVDDLLRTECADIVIAHGRVTMRTLLPAQLDASARIPAPDSLSAFALFSLSYPLGASVTVCVGTGDSVGAGQLLAQARPDSIEALRSDVERARRAASLEAHASELSSLERRLAEAREDVRSDSLELIAARTLWAEGFATAAIVVETEHRLREKVARLGGFEEQRALLQKKIALRTREHDLRPLEEPDTAIREMRSDINGVVEAVRRIARGRTIELTVVLRRWRR